MRFRFKLYLQIAVLLALCGIALHVLPAEEEASHNPKIESFLEELARAHAKGLVSFQEFAANKRVSLAGDMVTVILEPEGRHADSIDQSVLVALGVVIEAKSKSLIRARIPLKNLQAIAQVAGISFIRRPYSYAELKVKKVSQAVLPTGAVLFHSRGLLGKDVKVAIIDVGFGGLSTKAKREVPASVIDRTCTKDYTGTGLETGTEHGTAVAEIVHDMAPQAKLCLMKVGDEVDLENAVEDSIIQGVRIINHSIGWFNTNFGDGTGIIDEIANRAYRAGILWINAAGNHAKMHWQGLFTDKDSDGWHEFKGSDECNYIRAYFGVIEVFLTWNDWPSTYEDYDLFFFDGYGNKVAYSQNYQTGREPPTEELEFFVSQPGRYCLKILGRKPRKRMELKIFSSSHDLFYSVAKGSIVAPADAEGVLAVGAINYASWESGPQEPFSSQGPTSDGRIKPDISGPDGIRNMTFSAFFGTSAAAPHVTGAAALLLSKDPSLTAEKLRKILESQAIDLGEPGKDTVFGSGRLNLILGHVQASRTIQTPIKPKTTVQGDSFLVSLEVLMPDSLFGGITLTEIIPSSFKVIPLEADGAQFEEPSRWVWPLVYPGEIKKVTYKVIVPEGQAPGIYVISGLANEESIAGDKEIEVIEPLKIEDAVAHFDVATGRIDLMTSKLIEFAQLQQAVRWWLEERKVPGTGKTIGLLKIEELVAYWLTKTPVDKPLPTRKVQLGAIAWRTFTGKEVKAGETFEVEVVIKNSAKEDIYGLGLTESLPEGWEVQPLNNATFFKGDENQYQWLLLGTINPGEIKTIKYRVKVPAEAEAGIYKLSGEVSSASPAFKAEINGDQIMVVNGGQESAKLEILHIPSGDGIRFQPLGLNIGIEIEFMRLEIFNLAGRRVFDKQVHGNSLQYGGEAKLPNGVYLYIITVCDRSGFCTRGKLQKLLLLR